MRRGGRGAEGAHDGAVVFVEKVDAVGASGIPAGGPGLVVFEGEAVALGRGHFSGLDEFIFGGGEIVAGDDAFFAEQHGAAGAGSAGELHERGEIKLVAAQRALADNEVVEQARLEPRGDVATQDGVFAVIDAGGEAEAAEELSEIINEVAENVTTVYNSMLFSWYAENSTRLSYAEEAREEFGPSEEVLGDLHLGQYLAARETAQSFIDSLVSSL